jgi:hypothetical protein
VTAVKSQGTVEINGTTYYVYVAATSGNSAHAQSAPVASSFDLLQTHHVVHDSLI